ncbi:Protein CBG15285 [Caenorhabditis briggsae]|uniref:Protein CBG15285 n=1 Tax=Caenorhabditis briggsae TaxID=6238 RepID=A8XLH2_CAEBR|nr:Protein CBG15285 [Caenorhabditis briggsae]CAP33476.1 Protein CBG15285 [Caenorhabditis briggsae]
MLSQSSILLFLLFSVNGALFRFMGSSNEDPLKIVNNHFVEIKKACKDLNQTAIRQLIVATDHDKINITMTMLIFGSYEYYPTEVGYFEEGHIHTTVDMIKPGRKMYMYFFLRPARPSPSGWTIYNIT